MVNGQKKAISKVKKEKLAKKEIREIKEILDLLVAKVLMEKQHGLIQFYLLIMDMLQLIKEVE